MDRKHHSRKRIAIITHHWAYNFGANLQALATQRFYQSLGHDACILDYQPSGIEQALYGNVTPEQVSVHRRFCDNILSISPRCQDESDLVGYCNEFQPDVVLTGSDAVFRLRRKATREDLVFPNPFWLNWATSLKPTPILSSLAASSMGTRYFALAPSVQRQIGQILLRFDKLTVRDRWTQGSLRYLTMGRRSPSLCPDPVHMLNQVYALPDTAEAGPIQVDKKYILVSYFDGMISDQWIRAFVELAHQRDFEVFSLPLPEQTVTGPFDRVIDFPLSPQEWFAWIRHAAGYVGIRFHAIVSAMTNRVPFVAFDTYQWRNLGMTSKTYDLCRQAGMSAFCFNPKAIRKLSPERVHEMLCSDGQAAAPRYASNATAAFAAVAPTLLESKDAG